jgi:hypothetical protein
MHLCFMDESGHVPSRGKSEIVPYFVIAGLIIPETQWRDIAAEFERIKALPAFRVTGEIKWRYFGAENDDEKNGLKHLGQGARNALRRQLFGLITARRACRIVATKTEMKKAWELGYIKEKADVYHYTYKQTLERFEYFLQDITRLTGSHHLGMVICDHRGRDDDRVLREYHATMTERFSQFTSEFKHLVERVMLTESHHSVGIQLADLCAGAIGRAYNHADAQWMDLIRPNIRAHPQKGIDGFGLVHWPK